MTTTNVLRKVDLGKLLSEAQLPALPQSAIRLLELSQDPENGPAEFAIPIEADPGLTGQVLRFVNSSYFGFSREISSIKLAITLVGVRTIKNFALWSAVFSLMPNPKSGIFDLKKAWQDSLRRGLFARIMGKLLGLRDAEEAFAAALLQDMAVPLLAKELSQDYTALLKGRDGGRRRLSELEQERFGWNHGQAASIMATKWKLPAEFVTMIEDHANPNILSDEFRGNWGKLAVALSSLLPATSDETWHDAAPFEQVFSTLSPSSEPTVLQVLEQVDKELIEFAPVLKLSVPSKSLAQMWQETTSATV